jgi:hypothetical protein
LCPEAGVVELDKLKVGVDEVSTKVSMGINLERGEDSFVKEITMCVGIDHMCV